MKKILSLGIASAVLALTAISASAAVVIDSDTAADKVTKGSTVVVNFTIDQPMRALNFTVETTGLEYVDFSSPVGGSYNAETKKFGFISGSAIAANTVVFTQTYTVTADTDQKINVTVKDITSDNSNGAVVDYNVTVKPVATTSSDTSSTTSSDTTSSTTSSDTTSSGTTSSDTTTSSTTTSSATTEDPGKNPPTGVALAVFPAVIAGAAVVVAKKKRG